MSENEKPKMSDFMEQVLNKPVPDFQKVLMDNFDRLIKPRKFILTSKIEIFATSNPHHIRGHFPYRYNERFFRECYNLEWCSPMLIWVKNDVIVYWQFYNHYEQVRWNLRHLWLSSRKDNQITSAKWLDGNHTYLEIEMIIEER